MIVKNRNHNIIKRKFGSSSGYIPPNFNGPNNDPNPFTSATISMIIGFY